MIQRISAVLSLLCAALAALTVIAPVSADDDLSADMGIARSVEAGLPSADAIVIHKTQRRLELMSHGQLLRSYRVRLGLRPAGAKEEEGDYRTPEGHYRLARRNPRSDYFLSLEVSYPNDADLARAKRMGVKPGGAIMIHGLPNVPRKPMEYYSNVDWTDGCIAVSNSDMVEIWLMTRPDIPIEILP